MKYNFNFTWKFHIKSLHHFIYAVQNNTLGKPFHLQNDKNPSDNLNTLFESLYEQS